MRILSIQSHVVHGYVGNRSAVFPLQVLGYEVDFINSVQLSNHTGYKTFKGQVLGDNDLIDLLQGLEDNDLVDYTHIITDCDPVLGDSGKLYVPEELVDVYKQEILPLANIVFPNQFEAELLTGSIITDQESASACMDRFNEQYGVPIVCLTSTNILSGEVDHEENGGSPVSQLDGNSDLVDVHQSNLLGQGYCTNYSRSPPDRIRVDIPMLDGKFTGTGDLFVALFLGRLELLLLSCDQSSASADQLVQTLDKVIATMQAILRRTLHWMYKTKESQSNRQSADLIELKLVQSLDDIRQPVLTKSYAHLIPALDQHQQHIPTRPG